MSITMLNSLKDKQAIYIDDQVWVTLPSGNYLLANGNTLSGGYNSKHLLSKECLPIQLINKKPKQALSVMYEDGTVMDYHDWTNAISKVNSPYYDEDDERVTYPSLEVEFECRKELVRLRDIKETIYSEEEITYSPVELEIVGDVQDTGSEYIQNILAFDGKTYYNGTLYKVDSTKVVMDATIKFLTDNDLLQHMQNDSGRNYVRFMKVKGNYIFGDFHGTEQGATKGFKSLEESKKFVEDKIKEINNHLKLKLFGGASPIGYATRLSVHNDLVSLKGKISKLDNKTKDYQAKVSILRDINKLIDELKTEEN